MNRLTAENEIRTLLVEVVGGALLLAGLYFAYGQLQETAKQAISAREQTDLAKRQFADQRLENAMDRLVSNSSAVRALGAFGLARVMLEADTAEKREIFRVLAGHIREHAAWTPERKKLWASVSKEGRAAENDPLVGVGSLRKRAADVQAALSALSGTEPDPFIRADLREVDLQGAELGHAKLPHVLFSGAHLDYMDCRTGQGPYANFARADFRGAGLYGAYLHNADLSYANFDTPVDSSGMINTNQTTDLRHAEFRGAVAVSASFKAADLRGANFTPSRVRRTDLRQARFNDADLTGAVFNDADLTGAVFDGADLRGADLRGAKRDGASFKEASLEGARFQ